MKGPEQKKFCNSQADPQKKPGRRVLIAVILATITVVPACSYRYYLGMHGPSVKKHRAIHAHIKDNDTTCLMCHDPGSPVTCPKTTHPNFKGCLKCHNDDIRQPEPGQ